MSNLINKHKQEISRICEESGVSYLGVFGSQARGEAQEDSDVDLLVEFKKTPGLIDFIRAKQKFEKIFNKKVDLVTKKGLSRHLASYVNQDLQQIYG